MSSETQYRIEHDTMGEVRVPINAKYRAQTQRAVENFQISGQGLSRHHIAALGGVKKACARANAELGYRDEARAQASQEAAERVIGGECAAHYATDACQTGSAT